MTSSAGMSSKYLKCHKIDHNTSHTLSYSGQMENIFEATVHTLTKERHNGMGGIAQKHHATLRMPGGGSHRAQQSVGIGEHLLHSSIDATNLVQSLSIVGLEEGLSRSLVLNGIERITETGQINTKSEGEPTTTYLSPFVSIYRVPVIDPSKFAKAISM